eukprot:gene3515-biopygen3464
MSTRISSSETNADSDNTEGNVKQTTMEAMIPPVSAERRDELHRLRAFALGESDTELRDIFNYIFQGGYTPPCHNLVLQNILALSVKGKAKVNKESVQLYDVERPKKAATAVANPDGSKYGDHQLCGKDRDVV